MIGDKWIFSPASRHRSERQYYFSWIFSLLFRVQSVYFHVANSDEIITVQYVKAAKKFQHELWTNGDLIVLPVIIDIYSYERRYTSCLFKRAPYNGPETELKCKIGLEPVQYLRFIIWDLVHSTFLYLHILRLSTQCAPVFRLQNTWTLIYQSLNEDRGVESRVHSKKILAQSTPSQTEFL
jgi:hypothetical protein